MIKDTNKSNDESSTKDFADAINEAKNDSLKLKLLALYDNQTKRDEILEKGYNEEFYTLEHKYNKEYSQLNKTLSEIVNSGSKIPEFWKKAIVNSKYFQLNDKDKEILKYLNDVEVKYSEEDKKSVTIVFHFNKNDFFEHNTIEKTYIFNKKEDNYTESKSTEIKWIGTAPNIKTVKKKVKKGKSVSTITKEKKVDSFFNIFENKDKDDEEDEEDDDDIDNEDDLGTEADFIINDLVPFAMEYYLDLQKLGLIDDYSHDNNDDEDDEDHDDHSKKKSKKK